MGKASAVMRALQYSVVMKRELSKSKALNFRNIFSSYGHEFWVMTERIRTQVQVFEMRFLRRSEGVTLFDKGRTPQPSRTIADSERRSTQSA